MGWYGLDYLVQDRDKRALVNTETNLWAPYNVGR
jgi:hypothetical protein